MPDSQEKSEGADLREGLSIGLDVIGSPKHNSHCLGPRAARLLPLSLQQPVDKDTHHQEIVTKPAHSNFEVCLACTINLCKRHALRKWHTPLNDDARRLDGGLRGDGLGVQRVDVLSGGQHTRVPDGVAAWARLHVTTLQRSRRTFSTATSST